ncbi:hypothetical protein [Streptomyces collinus]|uniref:Uncharacterized protein n=2 Tax=Actinomycetes TaxID=1760 RepID=S5V8U6_STRC3|nr:hypothetical protein [Streptomyces collinus]AGS66877.1 hypothetical protein B446_00175 [Streptomyces collinus Tu 365]AGS73817.1 hypothetical protein B446_35115 [Streptomyces collinus Tu 365]
MPLMQPFASDWDRPASQNSEQWNWLAVEIAEIRRCAEAGDQAHDRLALILLDHLVEVIIGREVNAQLAFQIPDSTIEEMQRFRDSGGQLDGQLSQLIDQHVGLDRRAKMDNHLDQKTKFLRQRGVLTDHERDVLDRLHEYRNAAYHRETLEPDLIADLVLAYRVLADELLARHKPIAWVMASSDPAPIVTPHQLRGRLTEGIDIDLTSMARRFHDHATKRVQAVSTAVAIAQQLLGSKSSGETAAAPPDDDMARMLTGLSDTAKHLAPWTRQAEGLKSKTSSLTGLMVPFLNLDRALSRIEPSVKRLDMIQDWWEQRRIDDLRGK